MSSEFKDNLKLARKLRGLSQGEVADGIGVARSTYALYESGKRDPGVEGLKKIAKVLDVTGDFLLGNEEMPLTQNSRFYQATQYPLKIHDRRER